MAYESSYNDYSGGVGNAYGSYGYSFGDGLDDEISGGGREAGAYGKRSSSYGKALSTPSTCRALLTNTASTPQSPTIPVSNPCSRSESLVA